MKKLTLLAASAALIFASCAKTEGPATDDGKGQLIIKLNGATTRVVDNPEAGEDDEITLENGHVFVFSNTGALVHAEALDVDDATSTTAGVGQVLMEDATTPLEVTGSETVYIIGNLAAGDAALLAAMETSDEILEAAYSDDLLSLQVVDKFNTIPVANETGEPVAIASTTVDFNNTLSELPNYVATINLVPLMSRVELKAVQADDEVDAVGLISEFEIGGIYIDSYYYAFNYDGTATGDTFEQYQILDFDPNIALIGDGADGGPWISGNTVPYTAAVDDGLVWAYNVPSNGVARLIVKLNSVTYTKADPDDLVDGLSDEVVTVTNQFLTVENYVDADEEYIDNFLRGYIYRIGSVDDGNPFEFGPEDLDPFPNPTLGTLTVKVTVDDWEVVTPDVELM